MYMEPVVEKYASPAHKKCKGYTASDLFLRIKGICVCGVSNPLVLRLLRISIQEKEIILRIYMYMYMHHETPSTLHVHVKFDVYTCVANVLYTCIGTVVTKFLFNKILKIMVPF